MSDAARQVMIPRFLVGPAAQGQDFPRGVRAATLAVGVIVVAISYFVTSSVHGLHHQICAFDGFQEANQSVTIR